MNTTMLIILVIAVVLLLIVVRGVIHIVPVYQRLVVLQFGAFRGVYGPGLVFLFPPPIQTSQTVDLREFVVEIPEQTSITKDNAPIGVDFLIFQKVVEPADSVLKVQNFRQNVQGIASTTLRAVIGDMSLDDVLSKREQINEVLRVKLDEETGRWGVKIIRVEIRQINPPRDIQDAMSRQLSGERNRRAAILEAEGKKQSAILVAEGSKQSAILEAEGQRQAQLLKAEGFSLALGKINEVANTVDAKTMTLQYLDALRSLGASPATKFVLPMEFTSMLRPLVDLSAAALQPRTDGS